MKELLKGGSFFLILLMVNFIRSCKRMFVYPFMMIFLFCISENAAGQAPKKLDSLRKELSKNPRDIKNYNLIFETLKKWNRDSASKFVTTVLINAEDKQDTLFLALAYNFKASLMLEAKKVPES